MRVSDKTCSIGLHLAAVLVLGERIGCPSNSGGSRGNNNVVNSSVVNGSAMIRTIMSDGMLTH